MGVGNRQRRASKQRKRDRQQRAKGVGQRVRRPLDAPPSEREAFAGLLWTTVQALVDGDRAGAAELLVVVDSASPVFDEVVADAVALLDGRVRGAGWTDADLDEVRARRLKCPAATSARAREVRWLAVLSLLPPLPPVTVRRRPSAGEVDDGMLAKVRALLAKAESTNFPEEAEALTAKAQELMARHRIDRVLLDPDGASEEVVGRRIWLDDPYAQAKAGLLASVAATNRCRMVLLGDLGCAHVMGFDTDLEVVEMLHTSLLVQATTALAAAGPQRDGRTGRSRTRSFRQSFLVSYATRIGQRLRDASTRVEDEAAASDRGGSLLPALARRDERVIDASRAAFPHARPMLGPSVTNEAGWRAGRIAADAADLSVGPAVDRG
jgi:hypothetical protein